MPHMFETTVTYLKSYINVRTGVQWTLSTVLSTGIDGLHNGETVLFDEHRGQMKFQFDDAYMEHLDTANIIEAIIKRHQITTLKELETILDQQEYQPKPTHFN